MKTVIVKSFATLLGILLIVGIVPMRISASSAVELAAQINAIDGLFADAGAGVVTVTGTNENITTPLALNIDTGVTVNWEAVYTGSVSPATASMVTISGSGTFNVRFTGLIVNTGTGNTLNITGSGTTVAVYNSGSIQSSRSGSAILISANNVEIDVARLGTVISLDGNANAAIQIGGGSAVTGNVVNVNGGSVISIGPGFAINDGAGTALLNNNTSISITSGIISAGGNSAIHSTGINSKVVVTGGILSNAAGNNLNPVIDMGGDMGGASAYNITISGTAIVQSTSTNGYTLQTKGNVLIQDNAHIAAINGRAINLVGMDSVARIEGGLVETIGSGTAGSGTAISTATTNLDTVVRASIEVVGGTVTSVNGSAIAATGAASKVTVGGDAVVSTQSSVNHAINATGSGVTISIGENAEVSAITTDAVHTVATTSNAVTVSGNAKISSHTGRAIYSGGAASGVIVNGTCQIWVWNTGNAIYCRTGTVTLTNGFVFAYGTVATGTSNVVNAATINKPPGSVAMLVTWIKRPGSEPWIYRQGFYTDLDVDTENFGTLRWENDPVLGGGISYGYYYSPNLNSGFFPIYEVSVYRDFGLIFNSATGQMTQNVDGTGNLAYPNLTPFTEGWQFTWDAIQPSLGDPFTLVLNGFSWVTDLVLSASAAPTIPPAVPAALTIVGDTTIVINGDSRFESTNPDGGAGIRFGQSTGPGNESVVIDGSATLTAVGRNSPGVGIDIRTGTLTICEGTFIAQAGRAIDWVGSDPEPPGRIYPDPHTGDYIWTFSKNFDGTGGTTGFGEDDPFQLYSSDKFVMLKTVTPINLTGAVQQGGISRVADTVAIRLSFDTDVYGLTSDDIEIINSSGEAVKGIVSPTLDPKVWILTLNRVDAEGTVRVQISRHFENYLVEVRERSVQIYKAEVTRYSINLTNTVAAGGDTNKLFEFEIIFFSDPYKPQPISFANNQLDVNAFFVTYSNPTPIPSDRITGPYNTVLLLKHNESVIIHNFPPGDYMIYEHANDGFITAFNINDRGYFTAPDGKSSVFTVGSDIVIESFNSITRETPGEPERPFDPDDPEDRGTTENEKSPQTGDYRSIALPITILILGILCIVGGIKVRTGV